MSYLEAVEGLDTLPRRIFLEGEREPITDQDGFVLRIGEVLTPRNLLEQSAVLVVAPPWTGKTTVAEGISRTLKVQPFSMLTCFEQFERGTAVQPHWWSDWQKSEEPAVWIVDAIDEDDRKDRQSFAILRLLQDLPESVRTRLHLIAFCRTNEIPRWFEEGLEGIFGPWSSERPRGLRRLRLAGLDREAARLLVGPGRFDRVCHLIRCHDLRALAPLPAVLEYLAKRDHDEDLTPDRIWEGVLQDLLREKKDDPLRPSFKSEVEDRFAVAQKLAALTTFCGIGPVMPDENGLESLFPSTLPNYAERRGAVRETWRSSIFERSDRGFRFSQDHVRQWLTAFALRDLELRRLQPLLTRETRELDPSHEGVVGLLAQISRHPEVKDWLVTAHGGLPGPKDATWTLPEAARALDKLQEIARSSPWGLSAWREERLKTFGTVPGIGAEIARRLDLALDPAEQQLLLDMAFATGAMEPLGPAARLLQDERQDERVRARAADLTAQLGTEEHLAPLARWAESVRGFPGGHGAVLPVLVAAFYDRGLWDFEAAADYSLSQDGIRSNWLQYHLAEDLSLDRARRLIGKHVIPKPELASQPLASKALKVILRQEEPAEADFDLVQPLLLQEGFGQGWDRMDYALREFFERVPSARRKSFVAGLQQDPERNATNAWVWSSALEAEDAEWLFGLTLDRNGSPQWLWETLYFLSYRSGGSQSLRRRVRREINRQDQGLLNRLDRDRKSLSRRRNPTGDETHKTFELEPLVRDTVRSVELDLRDKMLRLSWYCFERPNGRPSNLSGQWEDLPAEMQGEVLAICRQALAQCSPTAIPDTTRYSSWILREAACFDRLVNEDVAFVLTSEMIRKWLPALLRAWVTGSGYEAALRKCFEVDRSLAEEVLLDAVRRAARSESGGIYILQEVPPELWSERFSAMLEEIVQDGGVATEARIDLLVRIGRIFPLRARPIARTWAEGVNAPLRDAGIDVLLMVAPEEGWMRLKALIGGEKPEDVLRRMRSLLPHHYGPAADFRSWPAAQLAELEEILLRTFPPMADPTWEAEEVRSLGEDDDLRFLRDNIPPLLYRRDGEGDRATVEKLADAHARIRQWLDDVHAQQGAESVIAGLGLGTRPPGERRQIPLLSMVKLLEDDRYRLLRTADDLLEVVLDELRLIAEEAKRHLSMLYHPKPGRKRLHEDALQAYLDCRLSDRLPAVLGAQGVPFIDREPLAARDKKNDLKVQAFSIDRDRLRVVIEVKWSDNVEVSTSLIDQLGEEYLLQNKLTHGIYLVGWSGATQPWKSPVGSAPEPRASLEAWRKALDEQARLFCQEHPGLRIIPLVMDLTWDPAPGKGAEPEGFPVVGSWWE